MPRGEHLPGNDFALKHGGEAAIIAIREGKPFSNLAQRQYLDVLDEMGLDLDTLPGLDRVVVKRLARLEAPARCFDAAALAAAEQGDVAKWERMQQRAGWLGGKVLSGAKDIKATLATDPGVIDAALSAVRDRKK